MKPLEGVKVVELGTHIAVPMAARLLADWGAEVIKVESLTGDLWRSYGLNIKTPVTDEENPIFAVPNSSKRLISLNLKEAEGREILLDLLKDADVFMSNVRLKGLKKLGLDYDSLAPQFPKLVYFHFTGYGYEGPWAKRPGFDIAAFWSAGGMLGSWTREGADLFAPSAAFGDATVASMAAAGVLAGVVGSKASGKGCYLTTSLFATAMWYNFGDVIASQPQYGLHRPAKRDARGNANPFLFPYTCQDGRQIYLAALEFERNYAKCLRVLGLEQYLDDTRYNTLSEYLKHSEEFMEITRAAFLTQPSAEWIRRFGEADIVIQEVMTASELSGLEQAWAEGLLSRVEYPEHTTALPNTPVRFIGGERPGTRQAGAIGCDTRAVLLARGFTGEQIDGLAARGVVRVAAQAT